MSLNHVSILGRLGQDPEVKMTASGQQVAHLSVATSEKWKDKTGVMKEETEWHRIVCWGALAELCAKYIKKGELHYFEGKLKTRSWETPSGEKKYTTEIICSKIELCGGRSGDREPSDNQQQKTGYTGSASGFNGFDEDVPF